jgi:hypothetical protein
MIKTGIMTMDPHEAMGMAIEIYLNEPNASDPKKLTNNRAVEIYPQNELPKQYSSGGLVDINLGELLSIGVTGYYLGDISTEDDYYPAVIGLEDVSKKAYKEIVISDGALKHNKSTGALPFQQAMVQGYYPKKRVVTESEIIDEINKKAARRADYPESCGLIINVYSADGDINFKNILDKARYDKFNLSLAILYHMPVLDRCIVFRLEKGLNNSELHLNSRKYILHDKTNSSK